MQQRSRPSRRQNHRNKAAKQKAKKQNKRKYFSFLNAKRTKQSKHATCEHNNTEIMRQKKRINLINGKTFLGENADFLVEKYRQLTSNSRQNTQYVVENSTFDKKRSLRGIAPKTSQIVRVQSVSRVLSWTVIYLLPSSPMASSEYVEMPSRHFVSFLAPSGVYMYALSPKRM